MRGNLIKAPLVAVLYASFLQFIAPFLPFSPFYTEVTAVFSAAMSLVDRAWILVYCLFVAVISAIVFASIDKRGRGAFLCLAPIFLGIFWVSPMIEPLLLGEVSGLMERWDLLMKLAQAAAGTLLLLLICTLLFAKRLTPEEEAAELEAKAAAKARGKEKGPRRFKIVKLLLFILLALPGIFFLLYFVGGYFLAWRNDAFRMYYGVAEDAGFIFMIITMLIDYTEYAGIALLRGLFLAVMSFLLMLRLMPGKARMFIILNTLFYLSQALLFLIPTPTMTWEVRLPHLISGAAVFAVYGALSAFLLTLGYNKDAAQPEAAPALTSADILEGKTGAGKPIPGKGGKK